MTEETVKDIEKTKADDYDSGWKEVMEKLFESFLAFFFPLIHREIDYTKPPQFLPDELREIDPDNKLGKRVADLLAKVFLKNGDTKCLSVISHIEIEGTPRAKFMDRMFVFYYRIYDRLKEMDMEIVSLAILIDDEKNFRPNKFNVNRWGFHLNMKIPTVKITDYLYDEKKKKELAESTNPMAMVVRAQLKSMELKGTDMERKYAAKCELLRECRRQNYGCEPTRVLFKYIGWTIRIPDELEKKLKQEINRLEEDATMQYIPVWEKDAWDEGFGNGYGKGFGNGYGKGKGEGRSEDAKRMLQMGFDLNTIAKITEIPIEEIKQLVVETPMTQIVQ